MTSDKPVYFLPPEHPSIAAWKDNFELLSAQADKKLTLNIAPDFVEELNVFGIQEMFLALQHYPQHIEKFLFGFEFHFQQVAESKLTYPGKYWKNEKKYRQWFFTLNQFMPVFFFIKDHDARLFALMGDWLAAGTVTINMEDGGLQIQGEDVERLRTRIGNICKTFYLYCHGSGFDAKPAVESVLFEYDFPGIAESVHIRYKEEVAKGLEFKVEYYKNKKIE